MCGNNSLGLHNLAIYVIQKHFNGILVRKKCEVNIKLEGTTRLINDNDLDIYYTVHTSFGKVKVDEFTLI